MNAYYKQNFSKINALINHFCKYNICNPYYYDLCSNIIIINICTDFFSRLGKRMSLDLQYGKDSLIHQNILGRASNEKRCMTDGEKVYEITRKHNIIDDTNEPKRQKHSIIETTTANMMMTKPIIRLTECNGSRDERKLSSFEDTIIKSLTVTTSICGLEQATTSHLKSSKPRSKNESELQRNFEGCVIDKIRMKKSFSLNELSHNLNYNHNVHQRDMPSNGAIILVNCVNGLDAFCASSQRQKL